LGCFSYAGFFGRTGNWIIGVIFGLLFLGCLAIWWVGIIELIEAKKLNFADLPESDE